MSAKAFGRTRAGEAACGGVSASVVEVAAAEADDGADAALLALETDFAWPGGSVGQGLAWWWLHWGDVVVDERREPGCAGKEAMTGEEVLTPTGGVPAREGLLLPSEGGVAMVSVGAASLKGGMPEASSQTNRQGCGGTGT